MSRSHEQTEHSTREDIIAGRNAVLEALRSGRQIDTIYLQQAAPGKSRHGSLSVVLALAKEQKIVVKYVTAQKLTALCPGNVHQGVIAVCSFLPYASLEEILSAAEQKGESPFLIICDEIEDPHNLGAVIRTAEAAGAHGVIVPKRRSAPLNQTVYRTSAGAASVLPVCRAGNLSALLDTLKESGIWIYCADMDGDAWCSLDYRGGVALIIGSEGKGVSRLLKQKADFTVSLPMNGAINSLNASVAGGIIMYEIARQRLALKAK